MDCSLSLFMVMSLGFWFLGLESEGCADKDDGSGEESDGVDGHLFSGRSFNIWELLACAFSRAEMRAAS